MANEKLKTTINNLFVKSISVVLKGYKNDTPKPQQKSGLMVSVDQTAGIFSSWGNLTSNKRKCCQAESHKNNVFEQRPVSTLISPFGSGFFEMLIS